MKDKVINIARNIFNHDVDINSKIGDFDGWDSLGQLNLFMALEEFFEIKFNVDEIIKTNSIVKIIELVNKKKK